MVHKTHGQKVSSAGSRSIGRGRKDIDIKDTSVKAVSVMIKGLSLEELSPEKDNTDVVEMKDKTPKIPKQTARRGIPLHGGERNVDRKTLRELKKLKTLMNQMIWGEV